MSVNTAARVLIMDDQAEVRGVAAKWLARLGYATATAADGREAIEQYVAAQHEGRPFDIVMVDLTVQKGMGGLEMMTELLRIDPHVTAVVSSGYVDGTAAAEYRQCGFQGVVAKPFRIAELQEMLQRLTGQRAPSVQ